MEMLTQVTTFNPKLVGKAIRIKGYDIDGGTWDRLYLVTGTGLEYIDLINYRGDRKTVHIENFGPELLTITLLSEEVAR